MAKKAIENPPLYVLRIGDRLIGEMEMDRQAICQFPQGERIRVDLRTGRVPSRLRWYWAFLHDVVEATGCAPSAKALHQTVKLKTACTEDVLVGGFVIKVPASVSFENMKEDEFTVYLESAIQFIAAEFGITPEQVKEQAA